MRKMYAPCKECGSQPCVCSLELKSGDEVWAAHCMNCDNGIGQTGDGMLDHPAGSEEEAEEMWNLLNTGGKIANYDALARM